MHAPQKDVCGDGAFLEHVEQMLSTGFNELQGADRIQLLALGDRPPAVLVGSGLGSDDLVQDVFPRANGRLRIGSREVGAGDLHV